MYHHPILKNQKSAAEQACLCGSINCKGILGGSKDSRDAENGFDEEDDLSDEENGDLQLIFGNKKAKKKFHGPRPLRGLDDVSKVQAFSRTLLQKAANVARTKQAIQRILATENTQSLRAFQRYHGLSILKFCFTTHQNNPDIASGVLRAMLKMPVSTRNTIEENGLFDLLRPLRETSNDDYLIMLINDLLNIWESLKLVYKIPKGRSERPISAMLAEEDQQRKDEADNAFISNYQTLYKTVKQSDVPKASPQKQEAANVLPPGWSMAQTEEGLVYYYGMLSQQTQWERPTAPDEVDETPDMARKRKLAALSTNDWAAITAAKEKEMRHEVGPTLMKYLSRYKDKIKREDFKKIAKKVTHALAEKEVRARLKQDSNPNRLVISMTEEMSSKIKKYIETYVVKHDYVRQEEVDRRKKKSKEKSKSGSRHAGSSSSSSKRAHAKRKSESSQSTRHHKSSRSEHASSAPSGDTDAALKKSRG